MADLYNHTQDLEGIWKCVYNGSWFSFSVNENKSQSMVCCLSWKVKIQKANNLKWIQIYPVWNHLRMPWAQWQGISLGWNLPRILNWPSCNSFVSATRYHFLKEGVFLKRDWHPIWKMEQNLLGKFIPQINTIFVSPNMCNVRAGMSRG